MSFAQRVFSLSFAIFSLLTFYTTSSSAQSIAAGDVTPQLGVSQSVTSPAAIAGGSPSLTYADIIAQRKAAKIKAEKATEEVKDKAADDGDDSKSEPKVIMPED